MKALVVADAADKTIDRVKIADVAMPELGAHDVLVETHSVGLNPVDYKLIENGDASWKYPHVLGLDVAGIVTQIGSQVTKFKAGDRVAGHGNYADNGSFAEFVSMPEYSLTKIPNGLSFEVAAALLCGALTAYQAINRKINIKGKHTILIHGGGGGVGSIAIQLAKLSGLDVITTVSDRKADFVAKLEPDAIINYQHQDVDTEIDRLTAGQGVDLIVDPIGAAEATKDLSRLAFNGTLVAVVAPPVISDSDWNKFSQMGLGVQTINLGGAHRANSKFQKNDLHVMLNDLLMLATEGKLDAGINTVLQFDEIKNGLQQLKSGHVVGKLVASR